jgi:hypothetical protein
VGVVHLWSPPAITAGGAIIVINTRWKTDDLSGRLLKQQGYLKSDQWEVLEFPAILPSGKPLWPDYWKP